MQSDTLSKHVSASPQRERRLQTEKGEEEKREGEEIGDTKKGSRKE